jgi:hypothetical protein
MRRSESFHNNLQSLLQTSRFLPRFDRSGAVCEQESGRAAQLSGLGRVRIPLPHPPFLSSSEGEGDQREIINTVIEEEAKYKAVCFIQDKAHRNWCSAIVVSFSVAIVVDFHPSVLKNVSPDNNKQTKRESPPRLNNMGCSDSKPTHTVTEEPAQHHHPPPSQRYPNHNGGAVPQTNNNNGNGIKKPPPKTKGPEFSRDPYTEEPIPVRMLR